MAKIHKGIIRGFQGCYSSGLGFLFIEDPERGILPVPCDNASTVRALENCFGPGVIANGHSVDDKKGPHLGQEIFWSYDDMGITLGGFSPIDASEAIREEYEKQLSEAPE